MSDSKLRILGVGAHPDDLEFACGGVLLAEAARGSEISLCICSRGEAGSNGTPAEREAEARSAAQMLGAKIGFLDMGGDAHLEICAVNNIAIARQIRTLRPDVLLSPLASPDQHPDHIVVSHLCRNAVRLARYGGLAELRDLSPHRLGRHLEYAITPRADSGQEQGIVRVDISEHFARWIELMECHQTQLRTRRYIELQTARARLLGLDSGIEYAQALYAPDAFLIKNFGELPPSLHLF